MQTLRPSVADGVALSYSADQKSFQPLATAPLGGGSLELVLDDRLSQRLKPQYAWWLRAELTGQGAVTAVRLTTDLQTSLFGLPELELGSNQVSYRDAASAPRRVRVTQKWVERTAWQRPPAPAAPVAPAVGATIEGTRVRFEWRPVESADGLADYHFELSEHADLRWPLSPNFEKYVSHTPQKGTASYETPFVGLLNPGQTYYWRVRARSQAGVWGPWGPVWSFRCAAPGTPLHVRLEALEDGRRYRLVWAANPAGRAPVAYRVYGSNEQGFTASDEPYVVDFGAGFCRDLAEYEARMADKSWRRQVTWPGNFVTEVRGTELVVAGPGLELEGANRAFYRVVAVDAQGNRSGPSDYAELPRPFIASLPPATAPAGQPYTYRPTVVTSIGHLTSKPGYLAAYWEREEPRWRLLEGPAGVRLDPSSGELTGTLPAGEHRLGIEVTTPAGSARQEWTTRIE
ncbi:MAG: hypothetical protein HUU35_17030 [Armatimonadetes bacterium]|nr:hypothetical protein [Armatimonadota bacterium]